MPKILSQAGMSLADTLDIEGSIIGIENLEAKDVGLVNDLGQTVVAERIGGFIARVTTGDLLQSVSWNLLFTELPPTPFRIMGLSCLNNSGAARVGNASLHLRQDPVITVNRELPLWLWEGGVDPLIACRWVDNGAAVTEWSYMRSLVPIGQMPSMGFGSDTRRDMPTVAFRGATTAFGAGTVEVIAQIYGVWMEIDGVSSHGLPIPSW